MNQGKIDKIVLQIEKKNTSWKCKPIKKEELVEGKSYLGIIASQHSISSDHIFSQTWDGRFFKSGKIDNTESTCFYHYSDSNIGILTFIPLKINTNIKEVGTNYYVRLDDNNDIHIGKSSFGWQFIFQTNVGYYESTKAGVNRFLKMNKMNLYDEYGEKVSIEDFWDIVEKKKGGLTLRKYYNYLDCLRYYGEDGEKIYIPEENRDKLYYDLPQDKCVLERFIKEEFIIDDLVFHDCEFS